jgi:hypothetical protein
LGRQSALLEEEDFSLKDVRPFFKDACPFFFHEVIAGRSVLPVFFKI